MTSISRIMKDIEPKTALIICSIVTILSCVLCVFVVDVYAFKNLIFVSIIVLEIITLKALYAIAAKIN